MAQKKNVSMNQFIIDAIFDSKEDSTSDSKSDIKMIEILEGQLAKKDEQVDKMQTLLDQQQQLTLQTNQQIQHLQLEETKEIEKKLEAFEEKEAKKGFFSRWFNSWNKKLAPWRQSKGAFLCFVDLSCAEPTRPHERSTKLLERKRTTFSEKRFDRLTKQPTHFRGLQVDDFSTCLGCKPNAFSLAEHTPYEGKV